MTKLQELTFLCLQQKDAVGNYSFEKMKEAYTYKEMTENDVIAMSLLGASGIKLCEAFLAGESNIADNFTSLVTPALNAFPESACVILRAINIHLSARHSTI